MTLNPLSCLSLPYLPLSLFTSLNLFSMWHHFSGVPKLGTHISQMLLNLWVQWVLCGFLALHFEPLRGLRWVSVRKQSISHDPAEGCSPYKMGEDRKSDYVEYRLA
jgi:hypothetical protein